MAAVLLPIVASAILPAGTSAFVTGLVGTLAGAAGGLIDSALTGQKKLPTVYGPRAEAISAQDSSYGAPISQLFGSCRFAGNIIWSQNIREVQVSETYSSGGGKGGGGSSQTQVTYQYYITMAVGICAGEIDKVTRIWADSTLLDISDLTFRIYTGSEDQLPDPTIEAIEGIGNTPAYRGLSYIVFEDLLLEPYANRIPNLTFEVIKKTSETAEIEDSVTEICIDPGYGGEVSYDTEVIGRGPGRYVTTKIPAGFGGSKRFTQAEYDYYIGLGFAFSGTVSKVGIRTIYTGFFTKQSWLSSGDTTSLNKHTTDDVTDAVSSFTTLTATAKNIEYISPRVFWYSSSSDGDTATVKPRVDIDSLTIKNTDEWEVENFKRNGVEIAIANKTYSYKDTDIRTYKGTSSDSSITNFLSYVKDNTDIKILFTPDIRIDEITPIIKPSKKRLEVTSVSGVTNFFDGTYGYNRFIEHYATLVAPYVDSFVIGSGLLGITSYTDSAGSYPAVDKLVTLAENVRNIFIAEGYPDIKIIYAADWQEYHSQDEWYNLDPLWSSEFIDVVGINYYMPLTDDLAQSFVSKDVLKAGFESGEGWDYYYTDPLNKTGQTAYTDRTFAWKDILTWWTNYHVNPDTVQTGWKPKLKPIWFTEFGYGSIDGVSNNPDRLYDPTSEEASFPRQSNELPNFNAQRLAIDAFIEYWNEKNVSYPNLAVKKFLYTWDIRPYPYYPALTETWSDYEKWNYDYSIIGKFGVSNVSSILQELCTSSGLTTSQVDYSGIDITSEGLILKENSITYRSAIQSLQAAYFFDAYESEGKIKFIGRDAEKTTIVIDPDDLLPSSGDVQELLNIDIEQTIDLPKKVEVQYLNRLRDYQQGTNIAERTANIENVNKETITLPIVSNDSEALTIADRHLYSIWAKKVKYSFELPLKYWYLEPTDVVSIILKGIEHIIKITSVSFGLPGKIEIQGDSDDSYVYKNYSSFVLSQQGLSGAEKPQVRPTELYILDLPLLPNETDSSLGKVYHAMSSDASFWQGCALYRSTDSDQNFDFIGSVTSKATVGTSSSSLLVPTYTEILDRGNYVDVILLSGELESVSPEQLYNGKNIAKLGSEIIQFATAVQTDPDLPTKYRLSNLLRGRLGTEWAVDTHGEGEEFALITGGSLLSENIPTANINTAVYYKPITIGDTIGNTVSKLLIYNAVRLKPFSGVLPSSVRDGSGNIDITWVRRTRYSGDITDGSDVPLGEASEKYEIDILDAPEGNVVRTLTSTSSTVEYTASQQVADFGTLKSSVDVAIYQISDIVGRGYALTYVA